VLLGSGLPRALGEEYAAAIKTRHNLKNGELHHGYREEISDQQQDRREEGCCRPSIWKPGYGWPGQGRSNKEGSEQDSPKEDDDCPSEDSSEEGERCPDEDCLVARQNEGRPLTGGFPLHFGMTLPDFS
jgi:hypothetical protein